MTTYICCLPTKPNYTLPKEDWTLETIDDKKDVSTKYRLIRHILENDWPDYVTFICIIPKCKFWKKNLDMFKLECELLNLKGIAYSIKTIFADDIYDNDKLAKAMQIKVSSLTSTIGESKIYVDTSGPTILINHFLLYTSLAYKAVGSLEGVFHYDYNYDENEYVFVSDNKFLEGYIKSILRCFEQSN